MHLPAHETRSPALPASLIKRHRMPGAVAHGPCEVSCWRVWQQPWSHIAHDTAPGTSDDSQAKQLLYACSSSSGWLVSCTAWAGGTLLLGTALGVAPRVSLKLLAKGLQLFNDFGECGAAARGAQHAPARPYIASNKSEAFLQILMQACHPSDMYSEMFTVRPAYNNDYEATFAHDLDSSRTLMKGSLYTISWFCCSVG